MSIKRVNDDMRNVEDIRTRANNYMQLDEPYAGETNVLHYLEVLRDRVGFDELKKKVVNPLKGRRSAHITAACCSDRAPCWPLTIRRTRRSLKTSFVPSAQSRSYIRTATSAAAAISPLKQKEMSGRMSCNIVDSAAGAGAEMLITACPLCMYNLNKSGSGKIPVYYFTELLAEALGVKEEALK